MVESIQSRFNRIQPKPYSLREISRSCRTIREWHALRTYLISQLDWLSSRRSRHSEAFGSPVPWLTYSCTQFLDQIVDTSARVLEFGSGASTLWWVARGNSVVAIEDDQDWAAQVQANMPENSQNFDLRSVKAEGLVACAERLNTKFDVVVIDNSGDRVSTAKCGLRLLAKSGIIVLDNSDRDEYRPAIEALESAGLTRLDFHGMGPVNAYAWTSSVFIKGEGLQVRGRLVRCRTVAY